jgi:phosphonate transport system ATP-binding protein
MIDIQDVWIRYHRDDPPALRGVDLRVAAGSFSLLVGPSGAGKTTLLRLIAGQLKPDWGRIEVFGQDVSGLRGEALRRYRRSVALLPQGLHLDPRATALTNVLVGRLGLTPVLPSVLGAFTAEDYRVAERCLARVGLADKRDRPVRTLSGGEQQRVAFARALAQEPQVILADEPTANVDHALGLHLLRWLRDTASAEGLTVLVVLHNLAQAREFDGHVMTLVDGRCPSHTPLGCDAGVLASLGVHAEGGEAGVGG